MIKKTVQDARALFLDSQLRVHSPLTLRFYTYHLKILDPLNEKFVHQVTADDLTLVWTDLAKRNVLWKDLPWRREREGELSVSTLHGYVRTLRTFFYWCIDRRYCDVNPAKALKRPLLPRQAPKHLTPEDLDRMLDEAYSDERDYAIVCFLADTACRVGGVAGLRMGDLDLEHRRAIVREKGRGGYGKLRTVFPKQRSVGALQRYLAVRRSDSEYVFCWREGGLRPGGIYRVLQRLAKKAGVESHWNPHAFRHGYARAALEKGANLRTVSRSLGHSTVAITSDIYLLWANGEEEKDHEEFSWLPNDEADGADRCDTEQKDRQEEGYAEVA